MEVRDNIQVSTLWSLISVQVIFSRAALDALESLQWVWALNHLRLRKLWCLGPSWENARLLLSAFPLPSLSPKRDMCVPPKSLPHFWIMDRYSKVSCCLGEGHCFTALLSLAASTDHTEVSLCCEFDRVRLQSHLHSAAWFFSGAGPRFVMSLLLFGLSLKRLFPGLKLQSVIHAQLLGV